MPGLLRLRSVSSRWPGPCPARIAASLRHGIRGRGYRGWLVLHPLIEDIDHRLCHGGRGQDEAAGGGQREFSGRPAERAGDGDDRLGRVPRGGREQPGRVLGRLEYRRPGPPGPSRRSRARVKCRRTPSAVTICERTGPRQCPGRAEAVRAGRGGPGRGSRPSARRATQAEGVQDEDDRALPSSPMRCPQPPARAVRPSRRTAHGDQSRCPRSPRRPTVRRAGREPPGRRR